MRALVLGGSVFVGKHTVDALLAGAQEVAVLNRGKTPTDLPDEVERLVADRTDIDQLSAALHAREWDTVFDVSGFVMAAWSTPARRSTRLIPSGTTRRRTNLQRWASWKPSPLPLHSPPFFS